MNPPPAASAACRAPPRPQAAAAEAEPIADHKLHGHDSEISTSSVSFAARYSRTRSGVDKTRARRTFFSNTVPATKNPMMQCRPAVYELGDRTRTT